MPNAGFGQSLTFCFEPTILKVGPVTINKQLSSDYLLLDSIANLESKHNLSSRLKVIDFQAAAF